MTAIPIAQIRAELTARIKSTQSRRSRNGNRAEDMLSAKHEACLRLGIANVVKVPTRILITKVKGVSVIGILRGKASTDYVGQLSDGRALWIEAKSFEPAAKLPRVPLSRIEPHQGRDLTWSLAHGGCALLVVLVGPKLYSVPWATVEEVRRNGAASLAPLDYTPYMVTRVDYLAREVESK